MKILSVLISKIKTILLVAPLIALVLTAASDGIAQTKNNVLKNAKVARLNVDIQNDARGPVCNIQKQDLTSAYRFPFSNSALKFVDEDKFDIWIDMRVVVIALKTGKELWTCIANIEFKAISTQLHELKFNKTAHPFDALLYQVERIRTAAPKDFRKFVNKGIADLSKEFIIDYNLDNK